MGSFLNRKKGMLILLGSIIIFSTSTVYLLLSTRSIPALSQQTQKATPTVPGKGTTSVQMCHLKQQDFEMGVSFPRWSTAGYGGDDHTWLAGLPQMRSQTSACWVSIPVLLFQASLTSTVIAPGVSTPSVASLTYGIQFAHAQGLHVFVTPLLDVQGAQSWAGSIQFATLAQERAWFDAYWQALKPYVVAAAQAGAEQFAIGTEEEWLQQNAPDALWNGLIANIHSIFHGTLTYNMNWTSLQATPPNWMHNPDLKMIGVSAYWPVVSTPERVDPQQIPGLWAKTVKSSLDAFAGNLGEPILVSEIGYRNSSDALYQPWVTTSSAPADPAEQAAACEAALASLLGDQHILGTFFWGWGDVGSFNLSGSQAAQGIQHYYQSLQN